MDSTTSVNYASPEYGRRTMPGSFRICNYAMRSICDDWREAHAAIP